jgi:hypothetical protein
MRLRLRRDPLVHAAALTRPSAVAKECPRRPGDAEQLNADGRLMQANTDQIQPDLKYFTQSRK